ncbi:MAG: DNA recombination protein RmuC [Candidatus Kerfeldbacteria bacterium]|nr:DNA recombination protein RmuC [Candidatus Kerfeldbacteria bacterium]
MNTMILFIFIILLCASNGLLVYLMLRQQKQSKTGEQDQSLHMLNQNMTGMQERLDRVSQSLNERLDNAARIIGNVNKELGTMQEIGRNMQALQDFLKSPKLRGNIGEQVLQQMLNQYFPHGLYDMQYRFTNGQIVDAVLKTDDGFIPIDSKFPMENYQKMCIEETEDGKALYLREFVKDVKKHVNDIAKKYILPDEGTVDFAIMYIPSESVYYEIIRHDIDLNMHGIERKVLFVSPNSFYYFLRVIMMGMQGKRVAEATKEIIATIGGIQKDAQRFGESLNTLTTHITHAKSAVERVNSEYAKLEGKIERIDHIEEKALLD